MIYKCVNCGSEILNHNTDHITNIKQYECLLCGCIFRQKAKKTEIIRKQNPEYNDGTENKCTNSFKQFLYHSIFVGYITQKLQEIYGSKINCTGIQSLPIKLKLNYSMHDECVTDTVEEDLKNSIRSIKELPRHIHFIDISKTTHLQKRGWTDITIKLYCLKEPWLISADEMKNNMENLNELVSAIDNGKIFHKKN